MLMKFQASAGNKDLRVAVIVASASAFLFIPLFVYRGIGLFDFWWWMSASLVILITAGILIDADYVPSLIRDAKSQPVRKIIMGLGAALFLFAVFYIGNELSRRLFMFAGNDINAIYGFKGGAAPIRILVLMALIIGPGEELFWRGFLQKRFSKHFGTVAGYGIATVLYAGVHVASGNVMLVLAAMVCGVFWGFLYYRYNSMIINIVSHTVWDIAVFLIFPFAK
jgi:uncharacterized protein